MTAIFITGTDTEIGKTTISRMLLQQWNQQGYRTCAMKPIASGCDYNENNQLVNEDALILQQTASIQLPYETVNPIALPDPIAPYLAAKNIKQALSAKMVKEKINSFLEIPADKHLIEGIGGWAQPLNETELLSDVISELQIPVVLVVGMRLGCLNHAILTYQHIKHCQVPISGWIANCIDPTMLAREENIQFLQQWISEPCLAVVPCKEVDVVTIMD